MSLSSFAINTGLRPQLLAGFTDPTGTLLGKSVRPLHLTLDEQSYMQRFAKVRGFGYNTMETSYFVTAEPLDMAQKKHKYFDGTNRVNGLGPIACPPFTAEHHHMIQWKEKKDVFSMACKAACKVGGPGPESTVRKPESARRPGGHEAQSAAVVAVPH